MEMLSDLSNIEMASKMLLGALQCANEINPVDYCLNALNIKIEPLNENTDEFKLLKHYINNTWQNKSENIDIEIKTIFLI